MISQRIELIKRACNKIQGKQLAIIKRQKELKKLVDSVLRSEYTVKQADRVGFAELDFSE